MGMDSALAIAASGMAAAITRLSSAASNLANAQVDGPVPANPPNEPVPQTPTSVYQASQIQQTTSPDGGVSASLAPTLPSYFLAYDPSSAFANSKGVVAEPNVDQAAEVVNVIQARAAFGASIAIIKAADGMAQRLFDLTA